MVTRLVAPEVLEELRRRLPADRVDVAAAFAHAYARRVGYEDPDAPDAVDLAGQIAGVFTLVDERGHDPVRVRAFTPNQEREGYETPGSVIEASCDDMPFLVDSITEELRGRNVGVRRGVHPIIGAERDADGRLVRVVRPRGAAHPESVMHFQLDRRLSPEALAELEDSVRSRLDEVRRAVRDFNAMEAQTERMIDVACGSPGTEVADSEETAAFLRWLGDGNFVFLGYREYEVLERDGVSYARALPEPRLGILSGPSKIDEALPLEAIEPLLREELTAGVPLLVGKTSQVSQIHRRRRMDCVSVRRLDAERDPLLECRLLGLFTAKAFAEPASRVPVLRTKLRNFLESEEIIEGSHDERSAIGLYNRFPKDELFAIDSDELRGVLLELMSLHGGRRARLLARAGKHGISFVVALPHERYDDALVQRLRSLLLTRCAGVDISQYVSLDAQDPALVHFRVTPHTLPPAEPPRAELEREVVTLARSWTERLTERLAERYGVDRGRELSDRWAPRFPEHYRASASATLADADIERLEQLEAADAGFVIGIQNGTARFSGFTRVGLYTHGGRVSLSDFTPVLESLGLRAVEEVPTDLAGEGEAFIQDFGVLGPDGQPLDLTACGDRVTDAITAVWSGQAEGDSLNRLVVSAGLNWRQVAVLRAYCTYRQRIGLGFTESHVNAAFTDNPGVAAKLAAFFELRFDPDREADQDEQAALRGEVMTDLDHVPSLDQDRVLREHLELVEATVRTNAFRSGGPVLAFKIASARVSGLPEPRPYCEVFACSPDVEAIHLRGGTVARGGVRWSDRREDYRNEVLGLMKAQLVKNSVISATGAKGGFVLKRAPVDPTELRAEAECQYTAFMHSLLDVTDNRVGGEIIHPERVRALDGPDSYLVVAPDKGTASLSDVANRVAREHGFWLDDAFASGGSTGYDHKALGITARGAWESVKRHLLAFERDPERDPVSVVGVGDMSGDVFGNGMLLSEQLRLVAAFDHRDLFIDPDPDPALAYAQRRRLFELPRSSWQDYDRDAISEGGGVWPRTAKSIPLSSQARSALGVEADRLPPTELIRAILRAPVDLLWSAGIGTWARASTETDLDVGDRASEAIRVEGRELRCRVIGEGGNLGLTQRARVEYEQAGGRLFGDFIDNSGGVDCSDREVNLKVLLGIAEERGDLDRQGRDELLVAVTDVVVGGTLEDSRRQAQVLTVEAAASPERMLGYEELMRSLEAEGLLLGRDSESLPSSDEMARRRGSGAGMTRPELGILLAYAKRSMKNALLDSDVADVLGLEADLRRYFPPAVVERFGHLCAEHPLRRELLAAIAANDTVNTLGLPVPSRLIRETGARPAEIVVAFRAARDTVGAVEHRRAIEALSSTIDPELWAGLMNGHDELVTTVTRWHLLYRPAVELEEARSQYELLSDAITKALSAKLSGRLEENTRELVGRGVPADLARRHALRSRLATAPDMIAVARLTGRELDDVARAFVLAGEAFHIDRMEGQSQALWSGSAWQRWALSAVVDDLHTARRWLAQGLIEAAAGGPVDAVLDSPDPERERLDAFMRTLAADGGEDLAALTVAARQIRSLGEGPGRT